MKDKTRCLSCESRGPYVQGSNKKYILLFLSVVSFSDYYYAGFFSFPLDPDT